MLRIYFKRQTFLAIFLFFTVHLSANGSGKESPMNGKKDEFLLSHAEFSNLKKNLRFTYLTELQKILTDASFDDTGYFVEIPRFELNSWSIFKLLLGQNFAEASEENKISEEDELQNLLKLTQKLIGRNGYFKTDDPVGNRKVYDEKKKKIDELIAQIKEKSNELWSSGDRDYREYYEEIHINLNNALSGLKEAGNEDYQYSVLKKAANKIKKDIDNYSDSDKAAQLKKNYYRCIYAGFVVQKKNSQERCRPVNRTKLFPGSHYEMDLKDCADPSKKVMCNPLLYGYKTNIEQGSVCDTTALTHLQQKKSNQAYCVDYGGNASQKCEEISGKDGKCVALKYIELNPVAWGELNTKLSQICTGKELKPDLQNTCNTIKARMLKLNQDVRENFVRFGGKSSSSNNAK